jgi:hypothetical protein
MGIVRKDEKAFDGILYTTEVFSATEGLDIFAKLAAVFGSSIQYFFGMAKDGNIDLGGELIATVMSEMSGAVLRAKKETGESPLLVLRDLLVNTRCDNLNMGDTEKVPGSVHDHFDTHFAGRYEHLIRVCIWVGSLNFIPPSGAKA